VQPNDHVVVTAADQSYASFLKGLVRSIRDGEQRSNVARPVPIKVLDLGLEQATIAELSGHCEFVSVTEPPFPIRRDDHSRPLLLSRAVRPFLPRYIPGFQVYTWLDADTWVQDVSCLAELRHGALGSGLSVVPALDRCYTSLYDKHSEHYRWMQPIIEQTFGQTVAEDLEFRPLLNSGVFSATSASPLWERFGKALEQVLAKSSLVRDQPAFNVAIYNGGVRFYPLPATYNWLCLHCLPRLDVARWVLTAPGLPHEDLLIVHLTRRHLDRTVPMPCSDGRDRSLRLDYLGLHAEAHRGGRPGALKPTGTR